MAKKKSNDNKEDKKELFTLQLVYTQGKDKDSFDTTLTCIRDGKESTLDIQDLDFMKTAFNGMKQVMGLVTWLYAHKLHDAGQMSDETLKMVDDNFNGGGNHE